MLVPISWLKDYVDIDVDVEELERRLFASGFEVEEKYQVGKDISGVVAGKVLTCEPIPDTHLHVCTVDAGSEPVQICCGADNVKAGGTYPVALPGATVYATAKDHVTVEGVMTIKKGKLRGYDSFGMLCSGTELGVSEDMYPGAGYNGLLVLPDDTKPGTDVKTILGLDDWIFDISITANRPDCQSIFGIAREVAAILDKPVKMPALDYTETAIPDNGFKVEVLAPELCRRYIGHYVKDVKIGESPAWMKRRLALVGINSISNIVDITNYILIELGQPMHAFDDKFLEKNMISVRRAQDGEKIVTLDEKEFTLTTDNLVICDGVKPVALAGIMGGLNSEIRETTTGVVFEAAKFVRDNIRKSSRALGQTSDSSQRFAKGVDEYATVMAMKRALHLVEELGCGTVTNIGAEVSTGNSLERRQMKASIAKVNAVLGIEVPAQEILRIMKALDFEPTLDGDELIINIPAYREDMEDYPDISEEVIRMYGFDKLVPTMMPSAQITAGGLNLKQRSELRLKRALCAAGAYEGVHYSFFSPADLDLLGLAADAPERNAIRIMNPINEELSLVRTTLVPQMIHAASRNQKRGTASGRLFEIGNRFMPKSLPLTDYPDELPVLSIGAWGSAESFFTMKGLTDIVADTLGVEFVYEADKKPFLHPYQTAKILCDGVEVGYLGKLNYEIQASEDMREPLFIAQIELSLLEKYYANVCEYKPLPKYAEEVRDLAIVMDKSTTCAAATDCIKAACQYVSAVKLFDVYEGAQIGADKKSMAFSVTFTPKDEEFTAEAVDGFVKKILKRLKFELNAEIRS